MNFNAPLWRPLRILLFPFSLLYGAIVWLRNRLFDKKWIGSTSFNFPVICVGNLSVGGTGKSPMVEYLIRNIRDRYQVGIISRGYKRKTRGYVLAGAGTTAIDIGDEPMLFYKKFPEITIAVGEERIVAIPQVLHDRPQTEVIFLDDAFQHRSVEAGYNILLTDCNNLFTRDWFLPTGDLRDERKSYRRADLMIVTKCPPDLRAEKRDQIIKELQPLPHQKVFFSCIEYGIPYHLTNSAIMELSSSMEVLLVSGIANPAPLKKYLLETVHSFNEILYDDHHIFTIDDWKEIVKRFQAIQADQKIILTTEKDAVRLIKFQNDIGDLPLYVLPIEVKFLFDGAPVFNDLITTFINGFRLKPNIDGEKTG